MKKTLLPLLCFLLAHSARSTVYYWDPEGTAAVTSTSVVGTWNTTSAEWSTANTQSASPVAWQSGDAACFCAGSTTMTTPFTVTLNSSVTIGGIFNGSLTPPGFFVTISGTGSLTLAAGADAFDTSGGDGGTTTIAVPMTGSGQVALEGAAQIYFNATNTYTGGTILGYPGVANFTGTLNFNNPYAFGTGPIQMSSAESGNAALTYKGTVAATITNKFIATNATLNINAIPAGLTFSGPWNLGATPIIGAGGSGNLIVISGPMSGTGGFTKFNASTLVLSGANTYTGITTISNGVLSITADNNLGTPPGTAAADLFLSGGTLNASNTFTLNSNRLIYLTANSTLGVSSGNTMTYAGNINGVNNLTKNGAGTLALTSASSGYTGATTISSGTLEADSQSGGTLGTNTVTVASGATLSGNGVVGGAVTATGNIAPGTAAGAGTLTLGNGLTLSGGGTYVWNLAENSASENYSTISLVGGNLNLGGSSKLSLNFTGSASAPSTTNAFWQTQEAWTIATVTAPGGNTNSTKFTTIVNGTYPAGTFSNYVYPGGNIVLLYQPSFPVFNALYDSGPGFFSGENLILTNFSGLALSVWSTTNASLAVSNWTVEGAMFEQALGNGYSRYSINVTPSVSPTYYIAGNFTTGPYVVPQAPATIMTTPDFSYFNVFTTNVAVSTNGVLALLPAAPTFVNAGCGYSTSSGFQLQFNAGTNQNYTVQASADLINWSNIATGSIVSSPITFTDSNATNYGKRFYRVVLPVPLP